MILCEVCLEEIEHGVKFKCTDGNVPIGARQRYIVNKELCRPCSERYAMSQLPNKIYMVNTQPISGGCGGSC